MRDHELMTTPNENAVAAQLAFAALDGDARKFVGNDGLERVIVRRPDGGEAIEVLTKPQFADEKPARIIQEVSVETAESLIGYARKFKAKNSLLLASISSNSITAALDYHAADRPEDGGEATFQPDHVGHTARLNLPYSLEWAAWSAADGKLIPQLDFVRFLEENREDIVAPDAATVLEACRDLQGLRKVDFRSVVREDSENYKISYEDETDARSKSGDVTLPSEFKLSIPVYFGGESHEVFALLRWQIEGSSLRLGIKLKRAERIRQAVFKGIVTEIAESTGIDAVYGSIASR